MNRVAEALTDCEQWDLTQSEWRSELEAARFEILRLEAAGLQTYKALKGKTRRKAIRKHMKLYFDIPEKSS